MRPNKLKTSADSIRPRHITALIASGLLLTASCSDGSSSHAADTTTTSTTLETFPTPRALPNSHFAERVQYDANTFGDIQHATDMGPDITVGQELDVNCLAQGPLEAAPSVEGRWYLFNGPEGYEGLFAAANVFENGDVNDDSLIVDPAVPPCPTE